MTERAYFAYLIGRFLMAINELDWAVFVFRRQYYLELASKTFIEKSPAERSKSLINGAPSAVKKKTFSQTDSEIMIHLLQQYESFRDIRNLVAHGTLIVSDLPVKADGFSPMVLHYMNSEDTDATLEQKAAGVKGTVRLPPLSVEELSQLALKIEHLSTQVFEILAVRELHPELSARVLEHVKGFKAGESKLFLEAKKEEERRKWEREQKSE